MRVKHTGKDGKSKEIKVGRNDPCPCGSGKKFKHCHIPKQRWAEKHPEENQVEREEEKPAKKTEPSEVVGPEGGSSEPESD